MAGEEEGQEFQKLALSPSIYLPSSLQLTQMTKRNSCGHVRPKGHFSSHSTSPGKRCEILQQLQLPPFLPHPIAKTGLFLLLLLPIHSHHSQAWHAGSQSKWEMEEQMHTSMQSKTSNVLQICSLNCQVTIIVLTLGSQLSEMSACSQEFPNIVVPIHTQVLSSGSSNQSLQSLLFAWRPQMRWSRRPSTIEIHH